MTRRARPGSARSALVALLASLAAGPLLAHDFWLEPSTFAPAPGQVVSVRLMVGQKFRGEPIPRTASLIEKFVLVTAEGETPMPGREGGDPAGLARAGSAGLATIAYRSRNSPVSLEAEKFEQYLKDEGLDAVSAARRKRGETGKPARELFARCAKALLSVGGAGASGADRALGLTLELVAEKNPYAVWAAAPAEPAAAASLPVRLLYEGKPLSGALIVAFPYDAPEAAQSVRTDAAGRAAIDISRRGQWLVKAVHMIPSSSPEADWQSLWASLTFAAPGAARVGKTP
ncbi:MAG TPA: DUF4198 domain-containing protein [Thermoanaerobaculia bacterium]|nr:DUF4198 domain-containing protein [Thermoanaerobaculia bacterium]